MGVAVGFGCGDNLMFVIRLMFDGGYLRRFVR